jgi:hypothetical protein
VNATAALTRTEETLQTVLTLLDPETREYVLSEMRDFAEQDMAGCAEQYEIAKKVAESDHVQEAW